MVKAALIAAVLLQIVLSLISEGLAKSLAELTAFFITVALIFAHNQPREQSLDDPRSDRV